MSMKRPSILQFQKLILDWYKENGRHDLPWRPPALPKRRDGSHDPYCVLVSEVMLQQTQVDRVIEKYKEFLRVFPTMRSLANASIHDLLTIWKGLGYNRRALNLQRAARQIISDYRGVFPRTTADIEKLPGIGPYTARAVATFAFNQPHTFIETNIRRIFIHFFFHGRSKVSDTELMPFIEKALYRKDPYIWYSALMDYGALMMKDIPNPNKKSKHYARQSRFEGSRRYARAKIIDFLIAKQHADSSELDSLFQKDTHLEPYRSQLQILLGILKDEGFIVEKRGKWMIRKRKRKTH